MMDLMSMRGAKVEHSGGNGTFATKQGPERHIRSPKDYFEMRSSDMGFRE